MSTIILTLAAIVATVVLFVGICAICMAVISTDWAHR